MDFLISLSLYYLVYENNIIKSKVYIRGVCVTTDWLKIKFKRKTFKHQTTQHICHKIFKNFTENSVDPKIQEIIRHLGVKRKLSKAIRKASVVKFKT